MWYNLDMQNFLPERYASVAAPRNLQETEQRCSLSAECNGWNVFLPYYYFVFSEDFVHHLANVCEASAAFWIFCHAVTTPSFLFCQITFNHERFAII
jgi:hypothetical protein